MKKIVQPEPELLNLELASKKSTKLLKTNRNWRTESGQQLCIPECCWIKSERMKWDSSTG